MLTLSRSHRQTTNIQVGRIETTVTLLRHFERLAIPHIPRDTIIGVDRSVRQAVRIGKQIRKRMLHEGTLALTSSKQEKELSTTPRTDQQKLKARAPDDERIDSANGAPMFSAGKPRGAQEASCIVSKTPSPVAPFCVDISLSTFRSFLDLIRGIRQIMSPALAAPARIPVGADKADSSSALNGKRTACKARVAAEAVGPESCEEPTAGSPAKKEAFGSQPLKQQHAAPAANVDGFAVPPRSVQMEVLRGTLKLLKVNLFHLVRAAAMRRACRESCVVKRSPEIGKNPVPTEGHEGGRRETKGADEGDSMADVVGGSGINKAERSNTNATSASQGVASDTLGQKGYPGVGGCDEDMHGVIRELHAELRTIFEEAHADTDLETMNAARAVQVRGVSYPCWSFKLSHPLVPCETPIDRTYLK